MMDSHNPFGNNDDFDDNDDSDLNGPMEDLSLSTPAGTAPLRTNPNPMPYNDPLNPLNPSGQTSNAATHMSTPAHAPVVNQAPANTSNVPAAAQPPPPKDPNTSRSLLASLTSSAIDTTGAGAAASSTSGHDELFGIDDSDDDDAEDLFGRVKPKAAGVPLFDDDPAAEPAPVQQDTAVVNPPNPMPVNAPPAPGSYSNHANNNVGYSTDSRSGEIPFQNNNTNMAPPPTMDMSASAPPSSFYRNHEPNQFIQSQPPQHQPPYPPQQPPQQQSYTQYQQPSPQNNAPTAPPTGVNQYTFQPTTYSAHPPSTQHLTPNLRAGLNLPHQQPSNNNNGAALTPTRAASLPPRTKIVLPPFTPTFTLVTVTDPRYVSNDGGFFSPLTGSAYWSYTVNSVGEGGKKVSVPRRFRHFVALEDRLRESCPGAILPPRPDKHTTRAIEEGQARQSSTFASARAKELCQYLQSLVNHPIAGTSPQLQFFLTFFDDLGTAWPEVSSSALTRLTASISGATGSVTSSAYTDDGSGSIFEGGLGSIISGSPAGGTSSTAPTEENAELLALHCSEHVRLVNVTQSIPKLEGAIALLRQHNERMGSAGMDFNKCAKDVGPLDKMLSIPVEILAMGLLKSARRTKRLALELSAAMGPFVNEYKTTKMERAAFQDRRNALAKRHAFRQKADAKAQKLMVVEQSPQFQQQGQVLERIQFEATELDNIATESMKGAEDIANIICREVERLRLARQKDWMASIKIMAASMKEACAEQKGIWEGARDQCITAFPEMGGDKS